MIRRISTKWVLTVLAAVVVPFVGFAWYVDTQVSARLWDIVRYYLMSIAGDLSDRIDNEIRERKLDVEVWAEDPMTEWALGDYGGDEVYFHSMLASGFDRFMEKSGAFDALLAVDGSGKLVVGSTRGPGGERYGPEVAEALAEHDFTREPWFLRTLAGETVLVDQHVSALLPPKNPAPGRHAENYHVGFALPVHGERDGAQAKTVGVVYALMNWSHVQYRLLRPNRPDHLEGRIANDIYSSSYSWLWKADADTILAHPSRELYGMKVSQAPVSLPQMVEAARGGTWGMFPEYTFRGVQKNAAFKHTLAPERGGFGWVVGIGIDNADIYATVRELRTLLTKATLSVLGIVVVGTVLIARRTTRPILELKRHTERVAAGDLETRIHVGSQDELGALAQAFNRMTSELAENRAALIKAEKDAAWREMARQVAHEIKNPLTPINLSIDLLQRAHREQSPQFDEIFERTVPMMQRQVEAMRSIASDFHAFAGTHRSRPEEVEVAALIDEVLALEAAWAADLGVRVQRDLSPARVLVDRGELRRVVINIVSNALEAMPDGGRLDVGVASSAGRVEIRVRDTGVGLSEEARARLFEPYFTTRTHGTGLGLAISRRLVEEMDGTIVLEAARGSEGGTIAIVSIPETRAPSSAGGRS